MKKDVDTPTEDQRSCLQSRARECKRNTNFKNIIPQSAAIHYIFAVCSQGLFAAHTVCKCVDGDAYRRPWERGGRAARHQAWAESPHRPRRHPQVPPETGAGVGASKGERRVAEGQARARSRAIAAGRPSGPGVRPHSAGLAMAPPPPRCATTARTRTCHQT